MLSDLGVRLKLGRARDAIGVPLDVVGNEHVALSDIWWSTAFELQDAVMKRRFIEVFHRDVGLRPKRVASIGPTEMSDTLSDEAVGNVTAKRRAEVSDD
jgi:hypothetical protein